MREESCGDRVTTRRAEIDQRLSDSYKYRRIVAVAVAVVVIVVVVIVTVVAISSGVARPVENGGGGARDGGRWDGRTDGRGCHAVRHVVVRLGRRRRRTSGTSAWA